MADNIAITRTILRGVVGSTVHGLNIGDAVDDRDEMGVCIEPVEQVAGLHEFEQYIYRSAAVREQDHNARSRAGDLDLVIYGLKKYVRLALKGNPSILTLLFTPESQCSVLTEEGRELRALAPNIISKRAGKAFLGYMQAQKQRLMGERGGRHGTRPELTGEHGYDTKYAMHILRLGYQGLMLMSTGVLPVPVTGEPRDFMMNVRGGSVPLNDVLTRAGEWERELKDQLDTAELPDDPDEKKVEEWMINQYMNKWKEEDANR